MHMNQVHIENRMWCQKEKGFTLLEILIALAISSVVMLAIYNIYMNQIHAANAQDRIVAMRQNWRAGQFVVGRELMKAGYSSKITNPNDPGFTVATRTAVTFTYVDDATEELVSVAFTHAGNNIVRTITPTGGVATATPVAEDIEVLEFIYQLKDGTTTWAPANLDDIRAVRVTTLARSAMPVPDYPNADAYALPFPDGETENNRTFSADSLYRQLVTGFFYCRNMAGK